MTRQERKLVMILRWWIVLFTCAAVAFAIAPDWTVRSLGTFGRAIFRWKGTPLEASSEKFWLVLAISLMAILILSAVKAQIDIVKNIFYVKIIITAKFVSTIGFLIALIFVQRAFAYLAGAIIDGLIFAITFLAYRRAVVSRYGK